MTEKGWGLQRGERKETERTGLDLSLQREKKGKPAFAGMTEKERG